MINSILHMVMSRTYDINIAPSVTDLFVYIVILMAAKFKLDS